MTADKVQSARVFSTAFKHDVMLRLEGGATLAGLARELAITRKVLYDWRKAWRAEGLAGLSRKRGRKFGWSKPKPDIPPTDPPGAAAKPDTAALALARAELRIAELERLVGRQQLGLDFFRKALQAEDAEQTQAPAAQGSTGSSKP
jgi:transposase